MKSIVTLYRNERIPVKQLVFSRSIIDWSLKTDEIYKQYGFVYTKRRLLDDLKTIPFGFKIV